MRHILAILFLVCLSSQAFAQTNWNAPPTDTTLSTDDVILYYCSSCTADATYDKMRIWKPSIAGLPAESNGSFTLGGGTATGINSFAIGNGATAGAANYAMAVGDGASLTGLYGMAFGFEAAANATFGHSFGYQAIASGNSAGAFGREATASGARSLGLGYLSVADQNDCVAIGNGSNCDAINTVYINGTTDSLYVGDALTVVGQSRVPSPMTEKTGNYTITADDLGGTLVYNSSGAGTFTIPDGLPVNNGDMIGFIQAGAGTLSFVSSGSMDLNSYDGFSMLGENGMAIVQFQSASKAFMSGHLN